MYMKRPSVYIRNIKHLDEAKLSKLFEVNNKKTIRFVRSSKDGHLDLAVLTVVSEDSAMKIIRQFSDTTVDGKKLTLAYRYLFLCFR